jgi:glycosyltransferase involved in cell wall biosynthesis
MKLIVTIPAHNEGRTVGRVVRGALSPIEGVKQIEVWVVDDVSSDDTAAVAEAAGASVIRLQHRTGLGSVFGRGLQQARVRDADVMVNIDGDGQFDPADIPELIRPIVEGRADFVTCTRFAGGRRPEMPAVKYWGNRAVVWLINRLCGHGAGFTDVSCGFRALNREAMYRLTLFGRFTYTQEVFMDLFRKQLRFAEVPLAVRGQREHGRSRVASNVFHYGLHSGMIMLRAVRDIKPLKFFGLLSGVGFALSGLMAVGLIGWYLATGGTSPFTSLVTVNGVAVLLSLMLLALGMMADMMARHRQVSEELLYLARKKTYGRGRSTTPPAPAADLADRGPRDEALTPRVNAEAVEAMLESPGAVR